MRRIHYGGVAFAASDEYAAELMLYSVELRARGEQEVVSVPVVTVAGSDRVTLILGSSAPMVSEPDPGAPTIDMRREVEQIRRARSDLAEQRARYLQFSDAEWATFTDLG